MRKFFFGLSVFAVFAFIAGLGFWQLNRLQWKENLIAQIDERKNAPFADLTKEMLQNQQSEFSNVRISGEILKDSRHYLTTKNPNNKSEFGFFVFDLLKTDLGLILVNRGYAKEKTVPQNQYLTTYGVLRNFEKTPLIGMKNDISKGNFIYVDYTDFKKSLKIQDLAQLYIYSLKEIPPSSLLITETKYEMLNHHLQYAITWFSLAFVFLVISLIRLRSNR